MADGGGCHACGCDGPALRCGACSVARYCSAACQRRAWPGHKLVCASLRQRAAAAAAAAAATAAAATAGAVGARAPAAAAAASQLLEPDSLFGELPPEAALGANLCAEARRAWEQAEVGRRAPELLARAPTLAQLVAAHPGVVHAAIAGKGRGLRAARAFAAGDTILREEAFAWFPHWGLGDCGGALDLLRVRPAHRAHLEGLLLQLAPYMADSAQAAAALAGDADLLSLTRSQLISGVAIESAFGVRMDGARSWGAPRDATTAAAAAAAAASDAPARTIDAICPVASLCNHSCEPNVAWVTDGPRTLEGVAIRLVAQRAILPGQELVLSYKPSTGSPRRKRRDALASQYGFSCACRRCSDDSDDDTVAFACSACGGGPVRVREQEPAAAARVGGGGGGGGGGGSGGGGSGGGMPQLHPARCTQCGADQAATLADRAAAGGGAAGSTAAVAGGSSGSGGGSDSGSGSGGGGDSGSSSGGGLTAGAVAVLMALRAQTAALPLPRLLAQTLLHAGDVALFEARFDALAALLHAGGDVGGHRDDDDEAHVSAYFASVAGPLRHLAAGCLAFLPHASHYLETFKRKRVLRDCALALVAGAGAGGSDDREGGARARELLAEAARIEATETGADSRRAALLAELAERPPTPAAVPRVYAVLSSGTLARPAAGSNI